MVVIKINDFFGINFCFLFVSFTFRIFLSVKMIKY